MKSTWFGDPHRKEFAKLIEGADYTAHSYDVFGAFLEMASGALRQGVNRVCGLSCRRSRPELA